MSSPVTAEFKDVEKGVSLWQDAFRRLLKNKLAVFGAVFIIFELVICLITPFIAPYGFEDQNLELALAAPSKAHWLGTDNLGRDLFTRVLYGGRISMMVGLLASFVSIIVGVVYGAIAGFVGGRTDNVMMRIVDVMFALPFVFLVIILMVYFGRNILLLFVALGLTQWLTMARIVRGQVISLKQKEFVEAAHAMGATNTSIIFRHLIPNALGPVIVYLTLTVPDTILTEAFLSFLGLGVQAPMASWGTLISNGVEVMEVAPWALIYPALALSVTLFSLNFLGDGLNEALDPKGARD
jgi:oligopeptide transport system permease protein